MDYVNVLGSKYDIYMKTDDEDKKLELNDGYCDTTIKKIVVRKLTKKQAEELDNCENVENYYNQILRHEIVHAFLFESGLHHQSNENWAMNEEMIDWMAIQMPKIMKTYESIVKPKKKVDVDYIDCKDMITIELDGHEIARAIQDKISKSLEV